MKVGLTFSQSVTQSLMKWNKSNERRFKETNLQRRDHLSSWWRLLLLILSLTLSSQLTTATLFFAFVYPLVLCTYIPSFWLYLHLFVNPLSIHPSVPLCFLHTSKTLFNPSLYLPIYPLFMALSTSSLYLVIHPCLRLSSNSFYLSPLNNYTYISVSILSLSIYPPLSLIFLHTNISLFTLSLYLSIYSLFIFLDIFLNKCRTVS